MQWICFITCLLVLLFIAYVGIRMGRNAVAWEPVYVMGFVCECQLHLRAELHIPTC